MLKLSEYPPRGFTLIELLVVVLIIGILAAIALPQYQLAVDKAEFANFQQLVKSIKTAFDSYYLINNEYPSSFDTIDVNFASSYEYTNYWDAESCVIFKNNYCCIGKPIESVQSENIICGKNNYSFAYIMYGRTNFCVAANGNDRALRLCKNISDNRYFASRNLLTPEDHNNNNGNKFAYYILSEE